MLHIASMLLKKEFGWGGGGGGGGVDGHAFTHTVYLSILSKKKLHTK